jgi:hypothetical protein
MRWAAAWWAETDDGPLIFGGPWGVLALGDREHQATNLTYFTI